MQHETTFKDQIITSQAVEAALAIFDEHYPDSNDYGGWLEKDSYRYVIEYKGKFYPPKHILSEITGISTQEFSGGEQTNRVFRDLGFMVGNK